MIEPLRPRDIERIPKTRPVASGEDLKKRQPGVEHHSPNQSTEKGPDADKTRLGNNVDERC